MNRNAAIFAVAVSALMSACAVKTDGRCEIDADCAVGAQCIDHLCTGGAVPSALFTGPETVDLGALVSLDGNASAREDGSKDGLVYEWTLLSPQGVTFEGSTDGPTVTFRATVPHETYRVQLVTRDRGTPSAAVVREVKVRNSKPVASLTVEPTIWTRNTLLTFDASGSTDADGDVLDYEWTLVKDPSTASGTLVPGDGGTATLMTADVAAKYSIKVVVRDEHGGSDDETLEQTLGNAPPTLDPGEASTVVHTCTAITCSATFTLSGTATDVDGSINADSVAWTLKSAPQAAAAQVVFQPLVQADSTFSSEARISNELPTPIVGDYVFEFKAKDNDGDESKATVTITVGNTVPTIAFAEEAPHSVNHTYVDGKFVATVVPSVLVADADGDLLSIEFLDVVTSLPGATVTRTPGVTAETASYEISVEATEPSSLIDGSTPLYEIKAKVTDNNGASAEATLPVIVLNRAPVISGYLDGETQTTAGHIYDAGEYRQDFAVAGLTISDPDGDPLDIQWTHTGGPGDTQLVAGDGTTLVPATLTVSSTDKALVNAEIGVTTTVTDAFGASVTGGKTLKMGNRLPVLTGLPSGQTTGHSYGLPAGVAGNTKGYFQQWNMTLSLVDPDGDPVDLTGWEASTADLDNGSIQKLPIGRALPSAITIFSTEKGIVGHDITLTARLSDGIDTADASSVVKMMNRKPRIDNTTYKLSGSSSSTVTSYSCNGLKENQCSSCNSNGLCEMPLACPVDLPCPPQPPTKVDATWGTGTGVKTSEGGFKPFYLKKELSVIDDDGDPVTVTFEVRSDIEVVNRFLDPGTHARVASVSTNCGAGGTAASVACTQKTTPFGFKSCGDNFYTQVDLKAAIWAKPHDGFENGNEVSRNIIRKSGQAPGGAICMVDGGGVDH